MRPRHGRQPELRHDSSPHHERRAGRAVVTAIEPCVATPLARVAGSGGTNEVEVAVTIDGRQFSVLLALDGQEHQRRIELGVGAVTSTGLLYGLWLLPSGVPVSSGELPEVKRKRLQDAPAFAQYSDAGFERLYSPIGKVTAIGRRTARSTVCIEEVAAQPPLFRRVAFVAGEPAERETLIARATSAGVGLALSRREDLEVLVSPPPAVRGRPGAYRWWIAEVAYRAWLYDSRSQEVS